VTRVRKWLGSSINLSMTWGELLIIVLAVILINAIWPGVPTWAFAVLGFAVGASRWIVRDVRGWLHRRRTT
jgi:uncharacterized membrane protein YhhN